MNPLAQPKWAGTHPINKWIRHQTTTAQGQALIERLDCETGFALVRSRISSRREIRERCEHDGNDRTLVITFGLSGQSEFVDPFGNALPFKASHTTVSVFHAGAGERRYAANESVQQLRLVVSESALIRYIGAERCERLLGRDLRPNEHFRQIAHAGSCVSEHLRFFRNPHAGEYDGLRQRIHALSLLAEQLNLLAPAGPCSERLKSRDRDALERIEACLRAHLDQPLNIAWMCTALGISEYKLKEYFRRAYGSSPARHLTEMRMLKAREMLTSGYRVSEAAYRVGYQHPSNFSAAFTRFFGYPPKSIRSSR
ncbi:helix-turn-helix domain-containing protein [Metapseudomonas furukawaii]|uniref:helix-turn-helix domain-containing protein n=1 Tax=Metapseudomonas furukawaii TaxID=1149133 RepID=UPI004046271F